ncbi:hypothetical protein ACFVZW_13470 [Streptomyces sp. NPDC059567]|uniref:hypothetical protein n=1 Tax=Streptomyces sp. NPDC059567 TaxID=3346867 RepID=UPI0036CDEF32
MKPEPRPDAMGAPTGIRPWSRTVFVLCLADLRRRLNLTAGPGAAGRSRRRIAGLVLGAGAAAGFGALFLLGRTLGALAPARSATADDLAAWTWIPAALWVLHQLLTAEPALGRSLVLPPDEAVLRTLPVDRGQLFTARLVLPTAGIGLAVLLAAGAVAVPWLAATDPGRELLPALLVNLCGAVAAAAGLRTLLVSAFMVRVVRVAHLPRLVLAAVAGWLLGRLAAPLLGALGSTPGQAESRLARLLGQVLTDSRPQLWTDMHTPGRLAWTAAGYLVLVVAAGTAVTLRVRATARRDAPGARPTEARPPTSSRLALPTTSPLAISLRVAWARLRRGAPAAVGGAARLQRLSMLLGAACASAAAAAPAPPWQLPVPALAGLLVAVSLIATGEVMQVCGIEAERGCWDVLRQSPLPTGAWPAAKAVVSALGVLAVTTPFYLGAAALCGVRGGDWAVVLLALPVVALGVGCAMVLTWYAVPRTESFEGARVTRAPAADVVEGVLAALLTAPVTGSLALCAAAAHSGTLGTCLLALVLAAYVLGLRRLSRSDLPALPTTARARHNPRTTGELK